MDSVCIHLIQITYPKEVYFPVTGHKSRLWRLESWGSYGCPVDASASIVTVYVFTLATESYNAIKLNKFAVI